MRGSEMEYWDIYDKDGRFTGKVIEKGQALGAEEFHLAMEAWVRNCQGEFLLQQRSLQCEILPGMWGLCTGRMLAGEDTKAGCIRELAEELGIRARPEELRFLRRILRQDGTQLIWDIYLLQREIDCRKLAFQPEEVAAAIWASPAQMREMIAAGELFFYPEFWEVVEQIEQIYEKRA